MKVAVYHSNSDIRLEERPVPFLNKGEILVKMMACGICGTDVMEWYRRRKGPRVLGHEMAGELVEVNGVTKFTKGDRVFVSHHVPCFTCRYCLSERHSACQSLHTGNYDPGGFSEFIRVPEANVKYGTLKLPENIDYEEATMIEPLACTVSSQKRLCLKEGQTMLILGCGISGLTHIRLAKLNNIKVITTDLNEYRLEKALEFGADYAVGANDFSADKLKELNEGNLAETVVVCTGASKAVSTAIDCVDRRGTILFFAIPPEDICLPPVRFWRDELSVIFSYGAAGEDLKEALELISSGGLPAKRLISHSLPLKDIAEGFRLVSQAGKSLKVVITPD